MVQALIAAKADVNAKRRDGATALMLASEERHLEVVQALIAAKADVNVKDVYGFTALITAAKCRYWEVVSCLLDSGANANAKGKYGETSLMYAAWCSNGLGLINGPTRACAMGERRCYCECCSSTVDRQGC